MENRGGIKKYEYLGPQEVPGKAPLDLFNLLEDIPGHPKGSTVSMFTLIEAGIWRGR